MDEYDCYSRFNVTEQDELTWHWLTHCFGAQGALAWLERWGEY